MTDFPSGERQRRTSTARRQAGRLPYKVGRITLADMAHPPRIPVWLPLNREVVYFITFCVRERRPVLANSAAFQSMQSAIAKLQNWWVLAAVVMPDHIHLLAAPKERDLDVGNLAGALKRWIRQDLQADWKWQAGCFDSRMFRSPVAHQRIGD